VDFGYVWWNCVPQCVFYPWCGVVLGLVKLGTSNTTFFSYHEAWIHTILPNVITPLYFGKFCWIGHSMDSSIMYISALMPSKCKIPLLPLNYTPHYIQSFRFFVWRIHLSVELVKLSIFCGPSTYKHVPLGVVKLILIYG
jgi:hypothetical protein